MNKSQIIRKVIRASAGTGKTYQLALEYIALLIQGVDPEHIVGITFTRKAAGEIRERVQHFLDVLESHFKGNEDIESKPLLQALIPLIVQTDKLNLAKILQIKENLIRSRHRLMLMTIDAFVSKMFQGLVIPSINLVSFQQIDDERQNELLQQLLEKVLTETKAWKAARQVFEMHKKNKDLSRYQELFAMLIEHRYELEEWDDSDDATDRGGNEPLLERVNQTMNTFLEQLQVGGVVWEKILLKTGLVVSLFPRQSELAKVQRFVDVYGHDVIKLTEPWRKKVFDEPQKETLRKLFADAQQALAAYFYAYRIKPFKRRLKHLLDELGPLYDQLKFRTREFTYQDILYYTYRFFHQGYRGESGDDRWDVLTVFYEHLSMRVRYLLIDEFQDTSILQWRVLAPLIQELTSDETQAGGVIAVGDEKQAIYGWRGGEQKLFGSLQALLQVDEPQSLTTSYRHHPTLVDVFSSIFKSFEVPSQSFSYGSWRYPELASHRQKSIGSIRFQAIKENADDGSSALESLVDELVSDLMSGRAYAPTTAVLARGNKDLDKIAARMKTKGIPVIQERSSSVLDISVIRGFMHWLYFIDQGNWIELLAFLRSDLICCADDEIRLILNELQTISIEQRGNLQLYEHPVLKDLYQKRAQDDESWPLMTRLQYWADVTGLTQSSDDMFVQKNVAKFFRLLADFCEGSSGSLSLRPLLDYLDQRWKSEEYRQDGLDAIDAVRLLTIHKAKGLEFESVYFYWHVSPRQQDRSELVWLRQPSVYFMNNLALEILLQSDRVCLTKLESLSSLARFDEEKQLLEEMNNLYVALTRAKSSLKVVARVDRSLKDILKLKQFGGSKTDDRYTLFSLMVKALVAKYGTANQSELEFIQAGWGLEMGELNPPDPALEPLEKSVKIERMFHRWQEFQPVDPTQENKVLFAGQVYLKGQLRGSFIHDYLSQILYQKETEHQQAIVRVRSTYMTYFSPQEMTDMISRTQAFILHEPDIFAEEWDVYTEVPIYEHGAENRIDRLMIHREKSEILIVDFKTGEEKDPQQLKRYIRLVQKLPFVIQGNYQVTGRFVQIPD